MARTSKRGAKGRGRPMRPAVRQAVRIGLWGLALALAAGAGWLGARTLWARVAQRPEFQINGALVRLDDCPAWVNGPQMAAQMNAQVGGLAEGRSIFAPRLAAAVQRTLSDSPWLSAVTEVKRTLPNNLQIQATFRKPAGLVQWREQPYMIDRDGHWLHEDLFRPPDAWRDGRTPVVVDRLLDEPPPVGARWGGPRLAVGARLTEFLRTGGLLEKLEVATIDVTGVGRGGRDPEIFLTTAGGTLIKWGSSSLYAEVPGLEPSPLGVPDGQKLQMLLRKLEDYPALRGIDGYVDVRFAGQIIWKQASAELP